MPAEPADHVRVVQDEDDELDDLVAHSDRITLTFNCEESQEAEQLREEIIHASEGRDHYDTQDEEITMQKDQIVLVAHQNTQTIDYVGVFDSAKEADAFYKGLRVRDGRAPNDTIAFTRLDGARDGWEGFWTACRLTADIDDPEVRELVEATLELE